jgi:DNA invertase Pin-like site-specific DNA recombinase
VRAKKLHLPSPNPPIDGLGVTKPLVAGYFRQTTPADPYGKIAAATTMRLVAYVRNQLPGAEWQGADFDDATACSLRFSQRPAASRTQLSLERGDHLVIDELATAFKGWSDFLSAIRLWETRGIGFHFLVPRVDSTTPEGRLALDLLKHFAQIERQRRAERTRSGNAKRKLNGKSTNGTAPYGFRLVGRRGFRRKIVDDYTRELGQTIVRWRLSGHSWESIYFHLIKHDVRTRDGREVSVGAIRRAFAGECRLQAQESERAQKRGS